MWRTRPATCAEVRGPFDLEERLASLISDRIVPRTVPELEILPWRRTDVYRAYPTIPSPYYKSAVA